MSVKCYSVPTFRCVCDKCGAVRDVEKDYDKIYNGAQAVRSLGWSFGKDKIVLCSKCRMDNYLYAGWYEKQSGHK